MNVLEAVEGIERHLKEFAVSAAQKIEEELPVVGNLAQQAAANPAVQALLAAVHLPQAPELLQALADEVTKIEAALAAAHAAGAASAQQPEAPPEPPADAPQS